MSRDIVRTEKEVCLGVAPFTQPSPARNPGGDCYACATYSLLRHFRPDSAETFDGVWNRYRFYAEDAPGVTYPEGTERWYTDNTWTGYGKVLTLLGKEYGLSHKYELIPPDYNVERRSAPWFTGYLTSWHDALAAHIDAGHLLFTSIRFSPSGQRQRGGLHDTDHAILIDGYRLVWVPAGIPGSLAQVIEYHVVCSARGAYWIDQDTLVWCHGFSSWIAVSGDAHE